MLDLGTLKLGIKVDSADAKSKLNDLSGDVGNTASKFKGGLKTMLTASAAIGGTVAAGAASLYKLASSAADAGDEIDKQSQKLGVTAEQYQSMAFAAEHAGFEMSTFTTAAKTLEKSGFEGNVYDAVESLMAIDDASERSAAAMELFGTKAGMEMAALLNGDESLAEYGEELSSLGGMMSDESVADAAAFKDSLQNLQTMFKSIGTRIGSELMPLIQTAMQWIVDHMPQIEAVISVVVEAVRILVTFVITAIGTIISVVRSVIETVISVVTSIASSLAKAKETVSNFVSTVVNKFNSLKTSLKNAATNALNGLLNGFKNAWNSVTNWVNEKVEWVKNKFSGISSIVDKINGQHRTGLREVPYDGYVAELHKGEMVLTAAEANQYQKNQYSAQNAPASSIVVNNYSPKALSAAETARYYRRTQRQLALGFGG